MDEFLYELERLMKIKWQEICFKEEDPYEMGRFHGLLDARLLYKKNIQTKTKVEGPVEN